MWPHITHLICFALTLFCASRSKNFAKQFSIMPLKTTIDSSDITVKQAEQLLGVRGIAYAKNSPKVDLIDKIDASGVVSEEQISLVESRDRESHYEELVTTVHTYRILHRMYTYDDVMASAQNGQIWLVVVYPTDSNAGIQDYDVIREMADNFGVKIAVLYCSREPQLCSINQWFLRRLLLIMPRYAVGSGDRYADVEVKNYLLGRVNTEKEIKSWIVRQMSSRVSDIKTMDELYVWMRSSKTNTMKVVLITTLDETPILISSLAIKYKSGIEFGFYSVKSKVKQSVLRKKLNISVPSFVVTMPNGEQYIYGANAGEDVNYFSVQLFLRFLSPNREDVRDLCLNLIYLSVSLHNIFWINCSSRVNRVIHAVINLLKYQILFRMMWWTIIAVDYYIKLFDYIVFPITSSRFVNTCLSAIMTTNIASVIRYDIQHHYNVVLLTIVYLITGFTLRLISKKLITTSADVYDIESMIRMWWTRESEAEAEARRARQEMRDNAAYYGVHNDQIMNRRNELLTIFMVALFGPPPMTDQQIDRIPVVVVNSRIAREKLCSICLVAFIRGESAQRLICRHYFHKHCVRRWLRTRSTCPNCRRVMIDDRSQRENYRRLFEIDGDHYSDALSDTDSNGFDEIIVEQEEGL